MIPNKVSDAQRRQMIEEAAYFRAERSGFTGDPLADWLAAEAEVDAAISRMESTHLLEQLENGLLVAQRRIKTLNKKLADDARAEWRDDVAKLVELKDALRDKVDDLRAQGEQAGHRARQQAEKLWDEISDTMRRAAARARH
jgi:hypothetical protein